MRIPYQVRRAFDATPHRRGLLLDACASGTSKRGRSGIDVRGREEGAHEGAEGDARAQGEVEREVRQTCPSARLGLLRALRWHSRSRRLE